VTLVGTGFTGATSVDFGDTEGSALQVASDTSLTVTTPAHAAGAVDVVVQHPNGVSAAAVFTYEENPIEPTPTPAVVSSLSPEHGPADGGTVVKVTGSGFDGATGATFGGTAGTAFAVVSDTELTVTTPAHAAGSVDVVVTHPEGDSVAVGFRYDEVPVVPGQPTEPGSPAAESQLTSETEGDITSAATAPAGSQLVVGVGAERAGEWVSAWLHSDPVHLGWHLVDANGNIRVTLPLDVMGEHRLVVLDRDGVVIGWNRILITDGTTTGARPGSPAEIGQIARTGLPLYAGVVAGMLALAAGLTLLVVRRRRLASHPSTSVHED
jgi:proteasome lid subunit RPN8/RPN11